MKFKFVLGITFFILAFASATFADESSTAPERLDESIDVETDQRGMTFFKVEINDAAKEILNYPEYYDTLINRIIHPSVRLPRFDTDIRPAGLLEDISKEDFIAKLKEYYDNNIQDILDRRQKARGRGYRDEHRDYVRTEEMFNQVRESAYVYGITLNKFVLERKEEVRQIRSQNPDGTVVEIPEIRWFWIGELDYQIDFWKFRMPRQQPAFMEFLDRIKETRRSRIEIEIIPVPTDEMMDAQGLTPEQKAQQIQEAQDRQNQEINHKRDTAWSQMTPSSSYIETKVKDIFLYVSKIIGTSDGNRSLFIGAGKNEGFKVDDGFYLIDSSNKRLGYSKLRHLGIGFVEAGLGGTKAHSDQSKLQLIKGNENQIGTGMSVIENPMQGFEFTLTFGFNFTLGTNEVFFESHDTSDSYTFDEATGGGFSLTLQFLKNIGAGAGISELWFGLDINAVLADNTFLFFDLVMMKRSYNKELNFEFGGGLGALVALLEGRQNNGPERISLPIVGLAVRLNFGIGYFISPNFELYARADIRLALAGEPEDFEHNGDIFDLKDGEFGIPVFNVAIEFGFRFPF